MFLRRVAMGLDIGAGSAGLMFAHTATYMTDRPAVRSPGGTLYRRLRRWTRQAHELCAASPNARPASSTAVTEQNAYFTVLGSFRNRAGAMRHLADLRRGHLALDLAVYSAYFKLEGYCTVIAPAYSQFSESAGTSTARAQNKLESRVFVPRSAPNPRSPAENHSVCRRTVAIAQAPQPDVIPLLTVFTSGDASHLDLVAVGPNEQTNQRSSQPG
jgi:hypothetical protein